MSKINNILNRVKKEGSIPRNEAIATRKCAHCMDEVSEGSFRDDQFRKKYEISGRCQSCQDNSYDQDLHKALEWAMSVDFD